jgi:hypothetical protein
MSCACVHGPSTANTLPVNDRPTDRAKTKGQLRTGVLIDGETQINGLNCTSHTFSASESREETEKGPLAPHLGGFWIAQVVVLVVVACRGRKITVVCLIIKLLKR